MENSRPAVLGGQPVFDELLPVVKPVLPPFDVLKADFQAILETGVLTKGPYLDELERQLAQATNTEEAVCVSSGTVGLVLLIKALEISGEVLLPSFTFMATGHAVLWNQLTPVFCDIGPCTWNLDPVDVRRKLTDRTSLIIGVHTFGNPAAVCELSEIAAEYRVELVFDSAHAFGARYRGQSIGQFGTAEVFSLSPTKLLIAGEGGVITTNDRQLAEELRRLRDYGNSGAYDCKSFGLNARMSEFQAALGLRSLAMVEEGVQHRNAVAAMVTARLRNLRGVEVQQVHPEDRSTYKDLSLRVSERESWLHRDLVARALAAEGVDTRPYFSPALHQLECYAGLGYTAPLPITEELSDSALTLPLYSNMSEETAMGIIHAVEKVWQYREALRSAWANKRGDLSI